MIHGLASKPPKADTHRLWKKALTENIKLENPAVAEKINNATDLIQSAYWANEIPSHIEDDQVYVTGLNQKVDDVIAEREKISDEFHVGVGDKIGTFFKKRGLDIVDLLSGALTIQDDVMKGFLTEVQLYSEDQYIADKIRQPLEVLLREAWDNNQEVAIISHSMGTFISYDVLWRFSHRSDKKYADYKNKKVRMFVTMGSPLGNKTIKDVLFAKYHKGNGDRQFIKNIDYWHNYSCLGDVVSHKAKLENDFFDEMQQLGLLKKNIGNTEKYAIDYVNMHNPFKVVPHKGNKDKNKSNPHKSYGYLVQPRLATWMIDFLENTLK